jgi:diguanylate cyclase (GGDEF)-like protein/PAS domain S-box-containing protein
MNAAVLPLAPRLKDWTTPLLLAALTAVFAYASLRLTRLGGGIASVWVVNGLVAGVLMLSARRHWARLLVAAALAQYAARLANGDAWLLAAALVGVNTLEAWGVAWWVRRTEPDLRKAASLGPVARAASLSTLVACLVTATLATLLSRWRVPPVAPLEVWSVWFMAHTLGMVVVATLVVCSFQPQVQLLGREGHRLDYLACIALLLAVCWLTFAQSGYPLLFLTFLPLLLLAYRHGLAGLVVGTGVLAVSSGLSASLGVGPFSLVQTENVLARILFWQFYVACGCLFAYTTTVALAERRRLEARLKRSEARILAITENLPAMVAHFDREQRFTYANQRSREVMRYDGDPVGKTLREVRGDGLYQTLAPRVAAVLQGKPQTFEGRSWATGDGVDYRAQFVPDVAEDGRVVGFYSMTFDITEAKEAQRKLASLARHDALTGVASRRHLEEELAQAADRARRSGAPLLVLALDLDRFKGINDTFGHAAGDEVLREFARRLRNCVYDVDLVGRIGGDEFVVLVEINASTAVGEVIAARIVDAMAAPVQAGGQSLQVASSIGIGLHHPVVSAEAAMALADEALYEAKARGRNTWALRTG